MGPVDVTTPGPRACARLLIRQMRPITEFEAVESFSASVSPFRAKAILWRERLRHGTAWAHLTKTTNFI
jgi:hypothetical protein